MAGNFPSAGCSSSKSSPALVKQSQRSRTSSCTAQPRAGTAHGAHLQPSQRPVSSKAQALPFIPRVTHTLRHTCPRTGILSPTMPAVPALGARCFIPVASPQAVAARLQPELSARPCSASCTSSPAAQVSLRGRGFPGPKTPKQTLQSAGHVGGCPGQLGAGSSWFVLGAVRPRFSADGQNGNISSVIN